VTDILSEKPCPRCKCHMQAVFKCGCGQIHDNFCVNCNRFVSLADDKAIELSIFDNECSFGHEYHDHPPSERGRRINAVFEATSSALTNRDDN
jgi:hypothetical protein